MYSMNEVVRTISEEPVIFLIKDIFPKTLNDVGYDLRRKVITIKKSATPNTCNTFWNIDTCEENTAAKSVICNNLHPLSDRIHTIHTN